MVTGRKSKSKRNTTSEDMGLFHTLDKELTESFIITCRRHAKEDRNAFNKVLKRQEEVRAIKIQFAKEKKMDVTKSQWIGASYSHQKYNFPQCAMTVAQAFKEFNNLQPASAKYKYVKDQIWFGMLGLDGRRQTIHGQKMDMCIHRQSY
jgi:hypothetical protein